jgi:hypothetical protein
MSISSKKIQDLLHNAWVALNNADRVEAIRTALDEVGYDQSRRDELRQVLDRARALTKGQQTAYSEQHDLTDTRDDTFVALDQLFALHRRLLRRYLKQDDPARDKLGLNGERSRAISRWLPQAERFYTVLRDDPDLAASAERYKLTTKVIDQILSDVEGLRQTNADHKVTNTTAQQATKVRNEAVNALEVGFADFKDYAGQALKDQPQYLEALGFGPVK